MCPGYGFRVITALGPLVIQASPARQSGRSVSPDRCEAMIDRPLRVGDTDTRSERAVTWRNPRPDQFVGARSYGRHVNRTDRLYALVEELRACAPRRCSARELASLYEVSARTIERDIGALQQAGVPIYADAGRTGVYPLDEHR